MKNRYWLLSGLLLMSTVIHAEGNCPPGYYPTGAPSGQGGPQSCAPIPEYNVEQQKALPQRQPKWVEQWMAIATDAVKGSLGTATDMTNRSQAERVAIADCRSKGGTQCKIDVSYANGCAAMVAGDMGYNVHGGPSLEEATILAMKTCTAATSNCHIYYSACSLPKRVQ